MPPTFKFVPAPLPIPVTIIFGVMKVTCLIPMCSLYDAAVEVLDGYLALQQILCEIEQRILMDFTDRAEFSVVRTSC